MRGKATHSMPLASSTVEPKALARLSELTCTLRSQARARTSRCSTSIAYLRVLGVKSAMPTAKPPSRESLGMSVTWRGARGGGGGGSSTQRRMPRLLSVRSSHSPPVSLAPPPWPRAFARGVPRGVAP